jgi:uncharacterized membrane protein
MVDVETGSGRIRFSPFHAVASAVGAIAGYLIGQAVNTPPIGVGTMISSAVMGAVVGGLVARFMIPPKPEMKQKVIWVRQDL